MPTITAVVHTKNSERTLDACLSSLQWCDEIAVIDMESSDESVAIAKKYTKNVVIEPAVAKDGKPIRIVEQIREKHLQKVKTEWTFIVDSDEEIPATLARKIQEAIRDEQVNAYATPRKNMIFGKWIEHTGFWPDYIVRLFRTHQGVHPKTIHQQLEIEGKTAQLPPRQEYAILHHHYDSIEQFLLRLNVYTSLEVEKRKALGTIQAASPITAFFDQFFSRYFHSQGYKDGTHGFILSLLMAVYMMVVEMKLWEIEKHEQRAWISDVEFDINTACRRTAYWVSHEELATSKNKVRNIFLRIKRKLNS